MRLIEIDRNGTALFEDQFKNRVRYSEKVIVSSPEMQDKLTGRDGIKIGYRVGFKDGAKVQGEKQAFFKRILHLLRIKIKA